MTKEGLEFDFLHKGTMEEGEEEGGRCNHGGRGREGRWLQLGKRRLSTYVPIYSLTRLMSNYPLIYKRRRKN